MEPRLRDRCAARPLRLRLRTAPSGAYRAGRLRRQPARPALVREGRLPARGNACGTGTSPTAVSWMSSAWRCSATSGWRRTGRRAGSSPPTRERHRGPATPDRCAAGGPSAAGHGPLRDLAQHRATGRAGRAARMAHRALRLGRSRRAAADRARHGPMEPGRRALLAAARQPSAGSGNRWRVSTAGGRDDGRRVLPPGNRHASRHVGSGARPPDDHRRQCRQVRGAPRRRHLRPARSHWPSTRSWSSTCLPPVASGPSAGARRSRRHRPTC